MPIPAYRAKQSTDTTGTGTIVLTAAGTNARSFAAAYGASSRRVMYAISWASGFEIGYGDFDGGTPGNLTRATVVASSNAGALVTLPAGTKDVFAVFDPGAREVLSISGTTTLALADMGNAVLFTGSSAATLNLPAIATVPLGAGWMVRNAGTAALTIDPNSAETINGAATLVLQAGQAAFIFDAGAAWECIVAGSSPWSLCEAVRVVSGVAQADFSLPASFRRFRLTAQNIRPDAANRNLGLRFSTDGGATFISGTSYTYHGLTGVGATASSFTQGGAGVGYLTLALGSGGNFQSEATAEIFPGNAAQAASFKSFTHGNEGTNWYVGDLGAACSVSAAANAIRVLTTSGNAAGTAAGTFSGVLILEGMA